MVIAAIDELVRTAFDGFWAHVASSHWRGREREAVSLFAFGFLVPQCGRSPFLSDARQIMIEGAVVQLPGAGRKRLVCKDLLLWSAPGMTVWNESGRMANSPSAILEWKMAPQPYEGDVDWLRHFSVGRDSFVGYAVSLKLRTPATVRVNRIVGGMAENDWLVKG